MRRTYAKFEQVERVAVESVERRHESESEVSEQKDVEMYTVHGGALSNNHNNTLSIPLCSLSCSRHDCTSELTWTGN